jgi:predicted nucleic acid-binding protein
MILVVPDTTPLRYLVEIGYDHVLPQLFTRICIPGAAARSNLVSIREALERLAKTIFRRTPDLFAQTEDLVRRSMKK